MNKKSKLNYYLVTAILLVVTIWIFLPIIFFNHYGFPEGSVTYGDSYGSVNALFSALAFAFLIYTALMQKEELELQREELELTRQELAKSATAQQEVADLTRKQINQLQQIRQHDINPIIKLVNRATTESFPFFHEVTLKPIINPLRVIDINILSVKSVEDEIGAFWTEDKKAFIGVDESFTISFVILNGREELTYTTWDVEIFLQDIDFNNYKYLLRLSKIDCELIGPRLLD